MRSITEFLLSGKIGKTNGRRIIKALLYVSVLIAVLVVIYELACIDTSTTVWVFIGLAVTVVLNGIALFNNK